jgi:hypothetical protein
MALKLQKSANGTEKLFIIKIWKFELGYQKYAEFHADSKTIERNAIN